MKFEIDLHIHHYDEDKVLKAIDALSKMFTQKIGVVMAKVDELLAELVEVNASTNEIAVDIQNLIDKLANGLSGPEAEAVKVELTTLKTKLQGIASTYTPGGGSRP